jgi:voltage-gated potassium channel
MFTALLILFGVVTAAFAVTVILESIFQRQIGKILLILGIKENGGKMKGHTIICGYGRIGRATVREMLAGNDDNLVIIEKDYDTCKHIEKERLAAVHGSAVEEDILEEAGLSKAVAVVAALPSDADNLFLVMTARNINPKLNIVARSEDEANAAKLLKAGATRVVSPYSAGGRNIFTLLTAPAVTDVTEMFASDGQPQMKVQQVRVGKDSNLAGKTIGNTYVQKTIKGIVLAIRRPDGNNIFNPDPSRLIAVGDTLYVVRPGRHNY